MKTNWINPRDGVELSFNVKEVVHIRGNFLVEVQNVETGYVAYLHSDGSIRTLPYFTSGFNGYYKTKADAQVAVNRFQYLNRKAKLMTDTKLNEMLKKTLDGFINQKKMFTALDVTNKFKEDNPGTHIFHNVVKGYVHDRYDNGGMNASGYNRMLADIATPYPWLYFIPVQHDPKLYILNAKSVPVPMPVPPSPTKTFAKTISVNKVPTATFIEIIYPS